MMVAVLMFIFFYIKFVTFALNLMSFATLALLSSNFQQLPKAAPSVPTAQVPTPVSVTKAPALTAPALNYITLGSFSWDQDSDKIKVCWSTSSNQITYAWTFSYWDKMYVQSTIFVGRFIHFAVGGSNIFFDFLKDEYQYLIYKEGQVFNLEIRQ